MSKKYPASQNAVDVRRYLAQLPCLFLLLQTTKTETPSLPENTCMALDKTRYRHCVRGRQPRQRMETLPYPTPDKLDIVGVVEPIAIRNERYTKTRHQGREPLCYLGRRI